MLKENFLDINGILYTLSPSGNEIYITGYSPNINIVNLIIPSLIDIRTVVQISDNAFIGANINKLTIPNTITSIGENSFLNITGLNEVIISPNSKLQKIGNNAFRYTGINSIFIPDSVLEIGDFAFNNINNLTKVTINNTSKLQQIGAGAFSRTSITNILIPDSVTEIKSGVFLGTSLLVTVNINETSKLQIIGDNAFSLTSLIMITIPKSVTNIEDRAFIECARLKFVYFLGDKPDMGDNSFETKKDTGIDNPIGYHYSLTLWNEFRKTTNKINNLELEYFSNTNIIKPINKPTEMKCPSISLIKILGILISILIIISILMLQYFPELILSSTRIIMILGTIISIIIMIFIKLY